MKGVVFLLMSLVQTVLPLPALAQGRAVVHQETYWQNRSRCQIRSANYTGPCVLTVISFGRSMNVHFDIDDLGSQGLTFGGNQYITSNTGAYLKVIGVVERFTGPDISRLSDGECSIEFEGTYDPQSGQQIPWDKTRRIICATEDGLYSGTAE